MKFLIIVLVLTASTLAPIAMCQDQIHPVPNPCSGKRIRNRSIPRDAPDEIIDAIRAHGVVWCIQAIQGADHRPTVCHVATLHSGTFDLHKGNTMAIHEDDTFTFTCPGDNPKICSVNACD